ncbi:MAG TPA: DUF2892 domain-containing protein [Nitrospiria bacterium]|nr:DUF2892 domain-containing protein [Nitrospiria bacterium]
MIRNIGKTEKWIRLGLGLFLLGLGYLWPGLPFWAVLLSFFIASVAIVTSLMNFCPLWMIFGINTLSPKSKNSSS